MSVETPAVSSYSGKDNLDAMATMGRYNRWIYDTIVPYLGRRVLEAGCGNGNITCWILRTAGLQRYVGVDLSESFCQQLRTTFPSAHGLSCAFHAMDLQNPGLMRLASPPFDSIVCLNVLEHVENDRQLLRRFHDMLEPGGRVVLQVPAFQALYGTIDAIDQHFRRYARQDLVHKVREAGFVIQRAFYFNVMGIPAWIWHGKIRRLKTHATTELKLWDFAVPLLQRLEARVRPPAGLSLFLMAHKPFPTLSKTP